MNWQNNGIPRFLVNGIQGTTVSTFELVLDKEVSAWRQKEVGRRKSESRIGSKGRRKNEKTIFVAKMWARKQTTVTLVFVCRPTPQHATSQLSTICSDTLIIYTLIHG